MNISSVMLPLLVAALLNTLVLSLTQNYTSKIMLLLYFQNVSSFWALFTSLPSAFISGLSVCDISHVTQIKVRICLSSLELYHVY
jgi:hypothetical protein